MMKPTRGQIFSGVLCLIPAIATLLAFTGGSVSANPIQDITLRTGRTAVILLVISLACTPLNNLFGLSALIPIRKILGLFAFFYASIHFLIFIGLDFEFNLTWIREEFNSKPFLRIGLAALLLFIPLAITSIKSLHRKMGRWWSYLQRLVYLITALALWHYFLAAKGDYRFPLIYTVIFSGLILLRVPPLSKISVSRKPQWLRSLNQFLLQ